VLDGVAVDAGLMKLNALLCAYQPRFAFGVQQLTWFSHP